MSNIKIIYKIYELDVTHLPNKERILYINYSKRVVFVEPAKYDLIDNFDTMDDAMNALKQYGDKYVQYTIIPEIYLDNE